MTALLKLIDKAHFSPTLTYEHASFQGVESSLPPLFYGRQVHKTHIIDVTSRERPNDKDPEEGDGVFSTTKGHGVAVKTADCLPVILVAKGFAMALHCGWRGLSLGMVEKGLFLVDKKVSYKDKEGLSIYLGPCIQASGFEVESDVVEAFIEEDLPKAALTKEQALFALTKGRQRSKWHFDMQMAAMFQMVNFGVDPEKIHIARICTKEDARFYSYRQNPQNPGRNISFGVVA